MKSHDSLKDKGGKIETVKTNHPRHVTMKIRQSAADTKEKSSIPLEVKKEQAKIRRKISQKAQNMSF